MLLVHEKCNMNFKSSPACNRFLAVTGKTLIVYYLIIFVCLFDHLLHLMCMSLTVGQEFSALEISNVLLCCCHATV
jgi:hypothetical protein